MSSIARRLTMAACHRSTIRRAAAAAAGAGVALAAVATVSAHAVQPFGGYTIAIGWLNEPTYVGLPNAVQVFVWQGTGAGYQAHPVSDLNGDRTKPDLQVTVSYGSVTGKALFLAPTHDPDTGLGNPAEYDAPLTPTQVGNYTFHLTGSVHGTAVDRSFTSGPDTFNPVDTQASVDFPNAVPDTGAVATKVDQVSNRLTTAVAAAQHASSSASDTASSANRATILAIVALVLAVLLGAANLAMVTRRRA